MAQYVKPKRFRRQYLINKAFQLKYSLYLVISGVVGSLLVALIMYWWWKRNNEYMEMMGMLDPEFSQANIIVIVTLATFVISTGIFLFFWGILLTHRMAGPIYVIKNVINTILEGKWPSQRHLRKKDEFKDIFQDLNSLVVKLREEEREVISTIDFIKGQVIPVLEDNNHQKEIESLKNSIDKIEQFFREI